MAKVIGPALSISASKSLGNTITFQKRPSGHAIFLKKKPGDVTPNNPSWQQRNQRSIIGLLVAQWQGMTDAERTTWNDEAIALGKPYAGYHHFIKTAKTNLPYYHGLQLYWSFNDGPRAQTTDLSGNGNHGNIKYYPNATYHKYEDQRNPKLGKCLWLDTDSGYISNTIGVGSNIRNAISLTAYYKRLSGTPETTLISDYEHFYYRLEEVDGFQFRLRKSLSTYSAISNLSILNGTPYFVVGAWDGISGDNKLRLYINGVETTYSTQDSVTAPLTLGDPGFSAGSSQYINRPYYLDELRVYNRALTPTEIIKQYQMTRMS